ncbi:hypothetical protein Acr_25g0004640 [Actinidia rufa]|uniref:Uncharacterized protein n=1 Tax=Actinidia rufa TaxID=165716 RepID=A0A7J0GYZ3_9ERIC|nr:hypothetical protein Acr_25g0004640 [Actinidia rufa]
MWGLGMKCGCRIYDTVLLILGLDLGRELKIPVKVGNLTNLCGCRGYGFGVARFNCCGDSSNRGRITVVVS